MLLALQSTLGQAGCNDTQLPCNAGSYTSGTPSAHAWKSRAVAFCVAEPQSIISPTASTLLLSSC